MENYFYNLPPELQSYIYSYDCTYYNTVKKKIFKEQLLQKCLTCNFRLNHFERRILDYIYCTVLNGDLFWFENDIVTTYSRLNTSKYFCNIEDIHEQLKIDFYCFQNFITFKILPKKYNVPKNDIKTFDGFVSTTEFLDNCSPTNYATFTRKQIIYMNGFVNYMLIDKSAYSNPFKNFLQPLCDLNEDEQTYDLFYIWMNLS